MERVPWPRAQALAVQPRSLLHTRPVARSLHTWEVLLLLKSCARRPPARLSELRVLCPLGRLRKSSGFGVASSPALFPVRPSFSLYLEMRLPLWTQSRGPRREEGQTADARVPAWWHCDSAGEKSARLGRRGHVRAGLVDEEACRRHAAEAPL